MVLVQLAWKLTGFSFRRNENSVFLKGNKFYYDGLSKLYFLFSLEICTPKCYENSYCENERCLCRRGFSMGFGHKCHPNEGETSIDMTLAMKGLLQKIAVK